MSEWATYSNAVTNEEGSADDLRFDGSTLDEVLDASYADGREQGYRDFEPDMTWDDYTAIRTAMELLMNAITPNGECMLCGQTFGFHGNDCPIHEVNIALDRVEL